MNQIPKKLRTDLAADPWYRSCARANDGGFHGQITWEHAMTYAGRQVQEKWAIVPLCWHHHLGPGLDKKANRLIALARATEEDLAKYPRADWARPRPVDN